MKSGCLISVQLFAYETDSGRMPNRVSPCQICRRSSACLSTQPKAFLPRQAKRFNGKSSFFFASPSSIVAMAGPQCCTPGPGTEHCCVGKEEPFGPFLSYVTAHHTPTAAVVLVNDIFGFDAPMLRKLADKTASAGYFVVVPELFNKDPYKPAEGSNPTANLGDWMKNHQPLDSVDGVEKVIEEMHKKGFSAVGAVGFCWGAKVVVQIAKGHSLKAAVLAHPSFVTVEDIQEVKTPIAILASEIDQITPPEVAEKFAGVLASKPEVESFVNIYPGVAHGWTVRYDSSDPKAVANAEEAHNKMYEWFGNFLH